MSMREMTDIPPDAVLLRILEGAHPVAAIRAWRGLDLADVARSAGMGADLIEGIEEGRTATPDEIGAIAAALKVKPAYLIDQQDDSSVIGDDEIPC